MHTCPTKGIGIGISGGGGGGGGGGERGVSLGDSVRPRNLKKCMKFNWNLEEWGMYIFWNYIFSISVLR